MNSGKCARARAFKSGKFIPKIPITPPGQRLTNWQLAQACIFQGFDPVRASVAVAMPGE
jgi:hypothetical protein